MRGERRRPPAERGFGCPAVVAASRLARMPACTRHEHASHSRGRASAKTTRSSGTSAGSVSGSATARAIRTGCSPDGRRTEAASVPVPARWPRENRSTSHGSRLHRSGCCGLRCRTSSCVGTRVRVAHGCVRSLRKGCGYREVREDVVSEGARHNASDVLRAGLLPRHGHDRVLLLSGWELAGQCAHGGVVHAQCRDRRADFWRVPPEAGWQSQGRSRVLGRSTLALASIALLLLGVSPDASAASWRSCGSFSTEHVSGKRVRVTQVRVRGTSCVQARRVARGFYDQIIGSSGAGYAAGFGCVYTGGSRVRCGSGADGRGPKKIRWRER